MKNYCRKQWQQKQQQYLCIKMYVHRHEDRQDSFSLSLITRSNYSIRTSSKQVSKWLVIQ